MLVLALLLSACAAPVAPAEEAAAPAEEATTEEAAPEEMASDIGSEANPIKVLFVPSVDAQVIVSGGELMAEALNEATGLNFEVSVPTSYAATIEEMCASPENSMGFIPGLGYVLANQLCGVDVAFKAVRFGNDAYWAQILVPRDSEAASLADLAGKTWAYPDAGSTSGYLAILPMITDAGIEIGRNAGSRRPHRGRACRLQRRSRLRHHLLQPAAQARRRRSLEARRRAGDSRRTDRSVRPQRRRQQAHVRRLACARCASQHARGSAGHYPEGAHPRPSRPPIPNDTLSFSPDFPEELRGQIAEALVAFAETEAWDASIGNQDFYGWTGINPASDEEYDSVRAMIEAAGLTLENLGE